MASGLLIPLEQYLKTSYSPDRDYLDGEVLERNLGEIEHSSLQREILIFLATRYPGLRKRVQPEQRVQVRANRFRIPDLCVLAEGAPREKVVTSAPVLCVEILSPEDTMSRTMDRVNDYLQMGVPACWIVDPIRRVGWVALPGRLEEAVDGILRAGNIEMPLTDVLE